MRPSPNVRTILINSIVLCFQWLFHFTHICLLFFSSFLAFYSFFFIYHIPIVASKLSQVYFSFIKLPSTLPGNSSVTLFLYFYCSTFRLQPIVYVYLQHIYSSDNAPKFFTLIVVIIFVYTAPNIIWQLVQFSAVQLLSHV